MKTRLQLCTSVTRQWRDAARTMYVNYDLCMGAAQWLHQVHARIRSIGGLNAWWTQHPALLLGMGPEGGRILPRRVFIIKIVHEVQI